MTEINTTPDRLELNIQKTPSIVVKEWLAVLEESINTNYMTVEASKLLFTAYNHIYDVNEYGYHCSSCRAKVANGLKAVIDLLKKYENNGN